MVWPSLVKCTMYGPPSAGVKVSSPPHHWSSVAGSVKAARARSGGQPGSSSVARTMGPPSTTVTGNSLTSDLLPAGSSLAADLGRLGVMQPEEEVIQAARRRAAALAAGDEVALRALVHPGLRWTTFRGE